MSYSEQVQLTYSFFVVSSYSLLAHFRSPSNRSKRILRQSHILPSTGSSLVSFGWSSWKLGYQPFWEFLDQAWNYASYLGLKTFYWEPNRSWRIRKLSGSSLSHSSHFHQIATYILSNLEWQGHGWHMQSWEVCPIAWNCHPLWHLNILIVFFYLRLTS